MTVCIASRTHGTLFGISDRMVTAGDIQFEPPAAKVLFLTSSLAIMASGDLSFHSEILSEVNRVVQEKVKLNPDDWILVKDVVDLYVSERGKAKLKRAEADILTPLNLDRRTFVKNQRSLDSGLVDKIAQELINYPIPDVSTIITGVDKIGDMVLPHIYTIHNEYVSCDDLIGFSAIGSGSRHAESQFMLARHAWNRELSETLLLTFSAKKDSEIAPGVGVDTDMFMIGPGLGQATTINEQAITKLEREYRKLKRRHHKAEMEARAEVKRYVDGLAEQGSAAQAERPNEGGEAAADTATTGESSEV